MTAALMRTLHLTLVILVMLGVGACSTTVASSLSPATEPSPTMGDTVPEMVAIVEPGSTAAFLMGSTEEELADQAARVRPDADYDTDDEMPAHEVTLTVPYEIGRYEVTNEQFASVMSRAIDQGQAVLGEDAVTDPTGSWVYVSLSRSSDRLLDQRGLVIVDGRISAAPEMEDHPVNGVSWHGALVYANALSEIAGLEPVYDLDDGSWNRDANGYRLPTEAEWEYAARGTERWTYAWGDALDQTVLKSGATVPVGFFDGSERDGLQTTGNASPFGVYDMTGYVWEWCWDWYGEDYYAEFPSTDPAGPEIGDDRPPYDPDVPTRVWRGGGYLASLQSGYLRVAKRWSAEPTDWYSETGFRIARTLP